VWFGGWIFAAAIILATGVALFEWLRIIDAKVDRPTIVFGCTCLAVTVGAAAWRPQMALNGVLICLVLAAALFLWLLYEHKDKNIAFWSAFGIPYLAGSGFALVYARSLNAGLAMVVYVLVVVWGTDIGAYIAGRLIGGPQLAPRISPKKTWAGLFGGMALAMLIGYIAAAGFHADRPLAAASFALVLAIVAQIGDLFKSYFKRRAGVKDSGQLIPGHGGVLDRIDGLVFAALFFVVFEDAMGAQSSWW